MIKEIKLNNKTTSTKIIIKNNFVKNFLNKLRNKNKKIICIVDLKIKYLIQDLIDKNNIEFIFIQCGEEIKNIYKYNRICESILRKIDRDSVIIAIGGGTLGDLGGFVASTILRGIRYVLIPTTLLSQVDSSIGGKNGINSKYGKNLIGTFYQPTEVLIDTSVLRTLSHRELKSGYAEIVKHALIRDLKFFEWLEKNFKKLLNLDIKYLEKAIYKSIMIKLSYVNRDPKENLINHNSRSMLNFGHTVGHALETFYNYNKKINHGEAISIGMIAEAHLSNKLGYLPDSNLNRIIKHFTDVKLKINDKNIKNKKLINFILKDKKFR